MKQTPQSIVRQCLEQMEAGQPIDAILESYSEYAGGLRPILESAQRLKGLGAAPLPATQRRARARFLAEAAAQTGTAPARRAGSVFRSRAFVMAAVAVFLVLVVGAALVPASASALPGDMLYGTKRAVEQVRLFVAAGPEVEAELTESFNQERVREVERLLADDRNAGVAFCGMVESSTGEQLTVEGLPVKVDPVTMKAIDPGVGMKVCLDGRTEAGEVRAAEVRVLVDDRYGGDEPSEGLYNDDRQGDDRDADDVRSDEREGYSLDDDGPSGDNRDGDDPCSDDRIGDDLCGDDRANSDARDDDDQRSDDLDDGGGD